MQTNMNILGYVQCLEFVNSPDSGSIHSHTMSSSNVFPKNNISLHEQYIPLHVRFEDFITVFSITSHFYSALKAREGIKRFVLMHAKLLRTLSSNIKKDIKNTNQ